MNIGNVVLNPIAFYYWDNAYLEGPGSKGSLIFTGSGATGPVQGPQDPTLTSAWTFNSIAPGSTITITVVFDIIPGALADASPADSPFVIYIVGT